MENSEESLKKRIHADMQSAIQKFYDVVNQKKCDVYNG